MTPFEDVIQFAVDKAVADAVKTAVEKAKVELDTRIPEIVAGLGIRVMQRVRMETLGSEIVIRIVKDEHGVVRGI